MYQTILTKDTRQVKFISIHRIKDNNSISLQLLVEMEDVLSKVEFDNQFRVIVIEGSDGVFCTGMDFNTYVKEGNEREDTASKEFASAYMHLLHRISIFPKVIIARVDGKVLAGGVGIVAVCDYVLATSKTTFGLSEVLWGLLPSMVLPYLIRRIGFQTAYRMTLTSQTLDAQQAVQVNLVDEISDNQDQSLNLLVNRLSRISFKTIAQMKQYFRELWIINSDIEDLGVEKTSYLAMQPYVRENIKNYQLYKQFPWESERFI